jgi:hypothetical protein
MVSVTSETKPLQNVSNVYRLNIMQYQNDLQWHILIGKTIKTAT